MGLGISQKGNKRHNLKKTKQFYLENKINVYITMSDATDKQSLPEMFTLCRSLFKIISNFFLIGIKFTNRANVRFFF